MIFLQGIKQYTCKAEVSFHELVIVLGAVYTRKVKYKVRLFTPIVKLFRSRVKIVFKYFINFQITVTTSLSVLDVTQLGTKVLPYKTFGTSY